MFIESRISTLIKTIETNLKGNHSWTVDEQTQLPDDLKLGNITPILNNLYERGYIILLDSTDVQARDIVERGSKYDKLVKDREEEVQALYELVFEINSSLVDEARTILLNLG